MMIRKQAIEVTIGLDGSIRAETIGIKGNKCLSSIAALEELLDAETIDSVYNKDFYESESQGIENVEETNAN